MDAFYTDATPTGFRTMAERFSTQIPPLRGFIFMLCTFSTQIPPLRGLGFFVVDAFYTDTEETPKQKSPTGTWVFLKKILKQKRGSENRAFAYFYNASRQSAIRFRQQRDFLADSRLLTADCYFKMTIFRMDDVSSVSSW